MSFADVTSANIVGFEALTINKGQKFMQGYQFIPVTEGETIDIQDIIPYDGNSICVGNGMSIGWWDPAVGYVQVPWMVGYFDQELYEKDPSTLGIVNEGAWTQDAETPLGFQMPVPVVKTFSNAQGFYVIPGCDNPKITISGAVIGADDKVTSARSISYTKGQKMMVSNPYPTALSLDQIIPYNGNVLCVGNGMSIGWWDPAVGYVQVPWMVGYFDQELYEKDPSTLGIVNEGAWTQDAETPLGFQMPVPVAHNFITGAGFYMVPGCDNPKLYFPNPFAPATVD